MDYDGYKRSGTVESMGDLFRKATSEILVLTLLEHEPRYVYQMLKSINRSDTSYKLTTLQPVVKRLSDYGYIQPIQMPQVNLRERKYFSITDKGRDYLRDLRENYVRLRNSFELLAGFKEEENRDDG